MLRREVITWTEFGSLIDHLLKQITQRYDTMVVITPSGLIPGGMLANALNISQVFTARVEFPPVETDQAKSTTSLLALPRFLDFPPTAKLKGHQVLIVDANWDCGRLLTSVQMRVEAAGGDAQTAVLHFCPPKNMLEDLLPDYFAAMTNVEIIYPWEVGFGDQSNLFLR